MDIQQKRVAVINMFGGTQRWMAKVQQMSDAQVTAIYLRKLNEASKPSPQTPLPDPDTPEQMQLQLGL